MPARRKKFLTPTKIILGSVLVVVILTLATWLLLRDASIPVLDPQGAIAKQQRDLIVFTTLLSVVVVLPVFTLLGVIAWKYREGNKTATYTPDDDGNTWLELLWWGIPIIIIGILSVVTWVTTHRLDPYKPISSNEPAVKVQVVALQWKWLFLYPEHGVATINEMRIPAKVPVNLEISADAPMSAFWIPSLAGQTYAMNGMTSKLSLIADKPGTFRGSNTNINGEGYARMHFNTIAEPSKDVFNRWINSIKQTNDGYLDSNNYQELAKPSKDNKVKYFELRDNGLYAEILRKYMTDHENKEHKEVGH